MRVVIFVALIGVAYCANTCKTYKSYVTPLIEKGDVVGLQKVFKSMNHKSQAVHTFRSVPIADTIWPETSAIKMLISLSKPWIHKVESTDMWPENCNIKISETGAQGLFDPSTSYHGGMRYIYNCATLQEKSIHNSQLKYDPSNPILIGRKNEQIFVPLENFVAANGDAMSGHIDMHSTDSMYTIRGFNKMSIRECGARQVFFDGSSASDCFESLKFFSLPEALESRTKPEEDAAYNNKSKKYETPHMRILVRRSYFVVMS